MKKADIFYILGFIFLCLLITDLVLWIMISTDDSKSFAEAIKEHRSYWPVFLQRPLKATLVNISFGVVSTLMFIGGYRRSKRKFFKGLGLALIIIGGLITCWQIFSLM